LATLPFSQNSQIIDSRLFAEFSGLFSEVFSEASEAKKMTKNVMRRDWGA
jgi:hypothetical protein